MVFLWNWLLSAHTGGTNAGASRKNSTTGTIYRQVPVPDIRNTTIRGTNIRAIAPGFYDFYMTPHVS